MNNIQKLIEELKTRRKSHYSEYLSKSYFSFDRGLYFGKDTECDFIIQKLKLLLKDESKQPQPPDFANTMLGEVPPVVNDGTEEHRRAVEGATPVVRQNEQQLKLCKTCGAEFNDRGTGGSYCSIKCFDRDVLQSG